jgi:hypothetical protein
MRWQEEVSLTTNEMQWTVNFFSNNSRKWSNLQDTSLNAGAGAGAVAYAKRKQWTWEQLRLKSDRTFRVFNKAYKSPL